VPSPIGTLHRGFRRLADWLPRGRTLPDDIWTKRHRGITVILWAHVAFLPIVGFARDYGLVHTLLETGIVAVPAVVGSLPALPRRARTIAASFGLMSTSAVLVHLSGGLIEMHFHFFVMVALVALYHDWIPFLTAIGYVLFHHGVMGTIDPNSVYNHLAAWRNPWLWAGIHALFIAGISLTCLVTWRLNENLLEERRFAEVRLREESAVVEALHAVGRTIAAELEMERLVQDVTDAATELTGAQFGAFFYTQTAADGEPFTLYSLSGAPKSAFEKFPLPRNTAVFAPTFEGKGVVRMDDVHADPRYGKNEPYYGMPKGHLPVRSYLAVPVFARSGEVLGGLFFGHSEVGRFNAVHERIIVGIAAQAAVAIDNARLYELEREARRASDAAGRQVALLAEMGTVLASSLEIDELVDGAARTIVPTFADVCIIDLVDDDGRLRRAAVTSDPSLAEVADVIRRHPPALENLAHPALRALREGKTQILYPFTDEAMSSIATDEEYVAALTRFRPTAGIVAPLRGRNRLLGTLSVATFEATGRTVGEPEEPVLQELARRLAVALENAHLYARQRGVAETLQHALLPERLPDIPGLQAAARYIAGGSGVDVGGDWYDVVRLPKGAIALALGDVVGRGERAASLMGQIRNAARAYAMDHKGPAEIAEHLNRLLTDLGHESMATMIFAILDPDSGTLRFVNAGHPPPLVVGPENTAEFLDGDTGVPLGATARARYTETVTTLTPGSTLLLYTDGLIEDRTTMLDDGLERLRQAAMRCGCDPETLCDTALEEAPAGRKGDDDVAMLAVRLVPLGERLHLRLPRDPTLVSSVRSTMRRWLAATGASEQEIYEIVLATGEACANAVQHAVGPARSHFEVRGSREGDSVVIDVWDQGRWRTVRATGGGRGIDIMRAFMDDVVIDRGATGTRVTMRRRLAGLVMHEATIE